MIKLLFLLIFSFVNMSAQYDNHTELYIRVFKKEAILEIWQKKFGEKKFSFLKSFEICAKSGVLGPKRKEGDGQIPEGFYFITALEAENKFYKGLRLNYPNESDKLLGDPKYPGSDILIHGSCFSTGCVSLTNEQMDQVYNIVELAKINGQKNIQVHIFPYMFSNIDLKDNIDSKTFELWKIFEAVQDHFEEWKTLPWLKMEENGYYKLIK